MCGDSPHGELDFVLIDDPSIDRHWIQFQVDEEVNRFFNSVFQTQSVPK